ncbi:hypothetical protein [Paenibacillus senegalensis]|uniref:hypothetical protein n=1 Tax=Paenibacillus senegalensis TaxID=1465766 RepID=UPI0002893CAE|nr:hypothetical protein [Paenibacillus senegalensis]
MQQRITNVITHMANSHHEMAKIIEGSRHISVQMAQLVTAIPDTQMNFPGVESLTGYSMELCRSVTAYLNGLAEMEEAIADHLGCVMKELHPGSDEE